MKCEKPLSNFGFNCNLRHYIKEARKTIEEHKLVKSAGGNVFPFDYSLYALNEQYLIIEAGADKTMPGHVIHRFFTLVS